MDVTHVGSSGHVAGFFGLTAGTGGKAAAMAAPGAPRPAVPARASP